MKLYQDAKKRWIIITFSAPSKKSLVFWYVLMYFAADAKMPVMSWLQ